MSDAFEGAPAGLPRLEGEAIHLRRARYEEWRDLREQRLSPEVLRYDHPTRTLPSIEDERRWWHADVESGDHVLWAVCHQDGRVLGFLSVFDLDRERGSCESGIEITSPSDYGRGYASAAYRLVLTWLRASGARSCHILTHPENERAIRLYRRLGFEKTGDVPDGPLAWTRMEISWQ